MKNIFAATAIATGLATTAMGGAVDVIIAAEPEVIAPTPQVTDWSGPYVGLMGSMGSGTYSEQYMDYEPFELDLEGTMYGAFAGYNFQRGSLVFGAEIAYSMGSVATQPNLERQELRPFGEFTDFTDLKARVGFAAGNALIYGIVGGSMGTWEHFPLGRSYTPTGYNYGAGIDLLVSGNMFLGAEFLIRELSDEMSDEPDLSMEATVQSISIRAGMKF